MSNDEIDMTPRYAPLRVIIYCDERFFNLPVEQTIVHPPGQHPRNCPIRPDMTVVELKTAKGSHWYGCTSAYINSELRVVVIGTPRKDEVRMEWEIVK